MRAAADAVHPQSVTNRARCAIGRFREREDENERKRGVYRERGNKLGPIESSPPSSGLSINVILFSPSIVVETLFPRNFDFGLSSPTMATLFAGEM